MFDLGLLPEGAYQVRLHQQGRPYGEAVALEVQAAQGPLNLELRAEAPSEPLSG